ncbi:MAG: NAD-dependent protein deacylase [Lachnospiraceae bacterium]|nr:NAD-dependent protein deacylase [Lachnospiraceae bacterium]
MSDTALATLKQWVEESHNIVFFGGAGVSTESGIPDFRSEDGLYRQKYKYPPEQMLSHSFFLSHTEEFFEYYKNQMLVLDVKPNNAHLALAKLEREGKLAAVVTQNIDGLHQAGGSENVLELHGSIHRNYCMKCHKFYDGAFVKAQPDIPRCSCGGIIKPDVVLYEEALDQDTMNRSVRAISQADLLIIGGTSLVVYPAAGLVRYYRGKRLVLINKGSTSMDQNADLVISLPIGQALEMFL